MKITGLQCNVCGAYHAYNPNVIGGRCHAYNCTGTLAPKTLVAAKPKTYGKWVVSTESGIESKSMVELGIFEGEIRDIAIYLRKSACYRLYFKPFRGVHKIQPQGKIDTTVSVHIEDLERQLGIKIGGYKFRDDLYSEIFKDDAIKS